MLHCGSERVDVRDGKGQQYPHFVPEPVLQKYPFERYTLTFQYVPLKGYFWNTDVGDGMCVPAFIEHWVQ